jgi:superfamily II DNA/RNA helicase
MNFNEMNLPTEILGNLTRMGILIPTEIQKQSIPSAIQGSDILASSQTGSGKTLAYLLPAITKILQEKAKILVLVPTRELAVQVCMALNKTAGRIKILGAAVIGGESFGKQVSKLMTKPDVIVATPGRLIDHLTRKTLNLSEFKYLVLDEMDRMLDMGMKEQIDQINKYLPASRQVLMFSATMPNHIVEASHKYLNNPHKITIGKVNKAAPEIDQQFIEIKEELKYIELDNQLSSQEGTVIVFVKTKRGADKLARNLKSNGHKAEAIHGDLNQGKRTKVLDAFRKEKTRILVATDVAARGLDVDHIKYVFNYDLPSCPEDYLHRIGRTGRAGAKGFAISFVSGADIMRKKAIDRLINKGLSTREVFKSSTKNRESSYKKRSSDTFQSISNRNQGRKENNKQVGYKTNTGISFSKKKKKLGQKKVA